MTIFSKLRRAKQAADDQKGKKAAATESKPPAAPYKHIPTHAASDALLGAPASWRERDKKAIQDQHLKRAQSNPTRNQSSLSNVTNLSQDRTLTSTDRARAATDARKHYSADWVSSSTSSHRTSQLASVGRASTAIHPVNSQRRNSDLSPRSPNMRRNRLDGLEAVPQAATSRGSKTVVHPYSGLEDSLKDFKFDLPSSGGELVIGNID